MRRFTHRACRAIAPLLWDYAADTLAPAMRERVETHLNFCGDCAAQAEACRQTTELMQAGRAIALTDPTNWETLRVQLARSPHPALVASLPSRRPWRAYGVVAASVALGALYALRLERPANPKEHEIVRLPPSLGQPRLPKHSQAAPPPQIVKYSPEKRNQAPIVWSEAQPEANALRKRKDVASLPQSDMAYINAGTREAPADWTPVPANWRRELERRCTDILRTHDDFISVPFPQLASADEKGVATAAQAYKQEKEIIDPRLARRVTVAAKGLDFAEFCRQLRAKTGLEIVAGRSVAEEKITVFCKEQPLRDLMRQITKVFRSTWLRSGEEGYFRYELARSMRVQLEEEELCDKDRAEALLDLNQQLENYRKNLDLSPEEARERSEAATGEEKQLLWTHAMDGSGPMQLFLSLSPDELNALRNGQPLKFAVHPAGDERPLPPGIGERLLNFPDDFRIRFSGSSSFFGSKALVPNGKPLSEFTNLQPTAHLSLQESEPGRFQLIGGAGFKIPNPPPGQIDVADTNIMMATGLSPSVRNPDNTVVNAAQKAAFQRDSALKKNMTIQPKASCELPEGFMDSGKPGPRVTSADVLETLHKATGVSIVADYFTRVYEPEKVAARDVPLFDALCHLADAMQMRWKRESGWLQFRSTGYFNEKRIEVPNRILERLAAARRAQGVLTLDDLAEIAQFSDTILNASRMSEGARAVHGLAEWPIARNYLRSDLRFFATLSPPQRVQATTEQGLPFAQMTPAQQRQFCGQCLGNSPAAEMIEGASLRVRCLLPVPKSEKEKRKSEDPKSASIPDNDPDKMILQAEDKRVASWKAQDKLNVQFIYRYKNGQGKRLHDNFGDFLEFDGKVFD